MGWPSRQSQWPSKTPCDECGATWEAKTKIYKINADTDKISYWCANENCPDKVDLEQPNPAGPQKEYTSPNVTQPDPKAAPESSFLPAELIGRHTEAWKFAIQHAALVHPENNTEAIRAKYILACVFYKGLMGVS